MSADVPFADRPTADHLFPGVPSFDFSSVRARSVNDHPPCPVAPEHCGAPMRETTTAADRKARGWRFLCHECDCSILVIDEPDDGV